MTARRVDIAKSLYKCGFNPFPASRYSKVPCKFYPNGEPEISTATYRHRQTTEEEIERLFGLDPEVAEDGNIFHVPNDEGDYVLLAIDFDIHDEDINNKNKKLEELSVYQKRNIDTLKKHPVSITAREGQHVFAYVSKNDPLALSAKNRFSLCDSGSTLKGEIIGVGGQLVLPPSIVDNQGDKGPYVWVFDPTTLTEIPHYQSVEELSKVFGLKLLTEKKKKKKDRKTNDQSITEHEKPSVKEGEEPPKSDVKIVKSINKYLTKLINDVIKQIASQKEGDRNNTLSEQAGRIYKYTTKDDVTERLKEAASKCGLHPEEVNTTLQSARQYGERNHITLLEEPRRNLSNDVLKALHSMKKVEFRHNIIKDRIEFRSLDDSDWQSLTEKQLNGILNFVRDEAGIKLSKTTLEEIIYSPYITEANPLKDYLEYVKEHYPWDGGRNWIQELAETITIHEDQREIANMYFRRWLIATIPSWLEQGYNETMLILKGNQGIGKSRWAHRLCPLPHEDYLFEGILNYGSDESQIIASEHAICVLEEVPVHHKNIEHQKTILTQKRYTLRRKYDRNVNSIPRHASFIGTTNESNFLHDMSGSRRFLVIECIKANYEFDLTLLHHAFAQAAVLYEQGERYWFTGDEIEQINANNEDYRAASTEEEALLTYFQSEENCRAPMQIMTTTQLLTYLESNTEQKLNVYKLGRVLNKNGFQKNQKVGQNKAWALYTIPLNISLEVEEESNKTDFRFQI